MADNLFDLKTINDPLPEASKQDDEPFSLRPIAEAVKNVGESWVKTKEIDAQADVRKRELAGRDASRLAKVVGGIGFLILVIALTALFLGKDQLTEKLVFAVVGFLGGVGVRFTREDG